MNIVGDREVPNRSLTVESDGRVTYDERFNATFHSDMDFRKYPFDTQTLTVGIESFSFPDSIVVFEVGSVRLPHHEPDDQEWRLSKPVASVRTETYNTIDGAPEAYSHFEFALTAERNPGYFVWQFFLPLILIIAASWAVFWISSFSDQIQTLFTLMLTVVAFNFYTSTLLPRLPYNTFIEITVISGYVSIFLAILMIVVNHSIERRKRGSSSDETEYEIAPKLMRVCRWLFPLGYSLFILGLFVSFHI
jgi:hypothetical protein